MSHEHTNLTNPFYNRQRIVDPAFFFGREREIEALYSAIVTRQCRAIVGERKLGKSSLLTHLADPQTLRHHGLDPDAHAFIYVDLEGMANISYDEFWPEILDRLELALPAGAERLQGMVADLALQAEIRFTQVRRLLRRVDRAGITVVLMLDEFESLANNAAFNPSFYGELRSLAGELGVVYLTASKRSLFDLTYRHADTLSSPFFNIFSEEPLRLLPAGEAQTLLRELSALPAGEPFTDEQCAFLRELAGPHPFFLVVAAHQLYAAREPESGSAREETVRRRFWAEAEDHFRYLWQQLTEAEQAALQQLQAKPGRTQAQLRKQLQSKALVVEDENGHLRPFSRTFARFLARTEPTERPAAATGSNGDLTGTTLGNYRVLSPLGRGGMAVVYKGYQPTLDRYVAIKVMNNSLSGEEAFLERFQREAAGVAQLRHQHIVQMYDFGVRDDISYMVMEYIEGETLKERLSREEGGGQRRRLPLAEAVQIVSNIASALDYAHAHGIVHRDVKPTNIMVRPEERLAALTGGVPFVAVLTDFGVARMLEGVQLTGTGATIGTPDYMSPEQARGEPAGAASDVYALGVVLYEMLAGELPFVADTPVAVLLQHLQADPPSIYAKVPELPQGLGQVVGRALDKRPEARFETAGALARALHAVTGGAR